MSRRLALVILAGAMLAGCATTEGNRIPCDPQTCTIDDLLRETRDPFPAEPISFGSIFGPQPDPGKITVEPK